MTMSSLYKYSALALFLCVSLSSCGGPKTTNLAPAPGDKISTPAWFLSPPSDEAYLYATATTTSRDMQLAVQKTETQARTNLAQQIESQLENITKQFQEEVGLGDDSELLQQFTSATRSVSQQTLVGSKAEQTELMREGDVYRCYVLMRLPIGKANAKLLESIQANERLLTRFRSTATFEELNASLSDQ